MRLTISSYFALGEIFHIAERHALRICNFSPSSRWL